MSEQRDLYSILGVSPDATAEEIQKAYDHKRANAHSSLDDAYHLLSNPEMRKAYDAGRASHMVRSEPWSSPWGMFDHLLGGPSLLGNSFHDWGSPSSFGMFNRMALPFSDPFFAAPIHGGAWIDPQKRLGYDDWVQKEQRSPGLWHRLFGSPSKHPVPSSEAAATDSEQPSFKSFSRSYSYTNEDGQVVVNAEEVSPDGTKTVYRRGPEGEKVTVNGVEQAEHPWKRMKSATEQPKVTQQGESSTKEQGRL